jgi:hypothetical protein
MSTLFSYDHDLFSRLPRLALGHCGSNRSLKE